MSSAPRVGLSIIVSSRASVDLPEPDSPTTASVRPASSENETFCNALTLAWRAKQPARHRIFAAQAARFEEAVMRRRPRWRAARDSARGPAPPRRRRRRRGAAGGEGEFAARREQTTFRPVELAGHDAGDRRQPPLRRALRQRREQRGGVGVVRILEQVARRVGLDLLAGILHDHAVRGLGDDAHVVGDEHQRHAVPLLQRQQQIEDLRLHA